MTLSILFAPQIRAFGKAAGRQFTTTEIQTIETTMNAVASLDDTGHVRFDLGAGPVGSIYDAFEMLSVGMGAPVTASKSTISITAGSNPTARAKAMNAAIRAGTDATKRDQATALVQTYGNPWRTQNATHKAFISNVAPDMASRLKAEAGVRA